MDLHLVKDGLLFCNQQSPLGVNENHSYLLFVDKPIGVDLFLIFWPYLMSLLFVGRDDPIDLQENFD